MEGMAVETAVWSKKDTNKDAVKHDSVIKSFFLSNVSDRSVSPVLVILQ